MRIPNFKDDFLDRFFEEKNLREQYYKVTAPDGTPHTIPTGVVLEHIAETRGQERKQLKEILRKLDYHNADVHDFLEHLAEGIAAQYRGASHMDDLDQRALKRLLRPDPKMSLKEQLIKLAYNTPELREDLVPILASTDKEAAGESLEVYRRKATREWVVELASATEAYIKQDHGLNTKRERGGTIIETDMGLTVTFNAPPKGTVVATVSYQGDRKMVEIKDTWTLRKASKAISAKVSWVARL